jgi:hypothetical protein
MEELFDKYEIASLTWAQRLSYFLLKVFALEQTALLIDVSNTPSLSSNINC